MRALPILLALALLPATATGQDPKLGAPAAAMSDPDDAPLPAGAVARLGSTRLRNGGAVYDFAFSPDGKSLATAGSGNNMRLWDVSTGRLTYEFPTEVGRAQRVAFSPDGRFLVTAAGGRGIQVWVADGRKEVARLGTPEDSVGRLAVSPDGKTLATAAWANTANARLWDIKTGKVTAELKGGPGGIQSLAFSPDGRLLAVAGYHRGAEIWEVASGQLRQKFTKFESRFGQASNAVFTPDGKAVLVHARMAIHAWDLATGKQLRQFGFEKQLADGSLALSPDGKLVASGELDGPIRVWDWQSGKEVRRLDGHQRAASQLGFSPDGRYLASTGSADNRMFIWDLKTGKPLHDPPGHRAEVISVAVSPDGKLVATGSTDRSLRLWDRATAKELWKLELGFNHPLGRVVFSPDGKHVAYSTCQGQNLNHAALVDVASGKEVRRIGKDMPAIRALAFAPDGKSLVTGGGGILKFWDVETGKIIREAISSKPNFSLWHAEFSPDGKTVAVAKFNREVGILGPGDEQVQVLGEHGGSTFSVAFTPDGKHVVSGAADFTARLWEVATRKEVRRYGGHGGHVFGVAVSPDGKLLATASLDRLVRLWDLATGEELGTFAGHGAAVMAVAFSRDGKHVVSGSGDGTALVWDVRRMLHPDADGVAKLDPKELERLWADLGSEDAMKAFKALQALVQAPGQAAALVRERLTPVKIRAEVARLLGDLESPKFAEREKATAALEKLGHGVVTDLKRALDGKLSDEARRRVTGILDRLAKLKPLPEDEKRDRLRAVRSIELLEHIGTPQARAVLEALVRQDPDSPTGREAAAALGRLKQRQ